MNFGDILNKLDEDGNGFDIGDLKNITHLNLGEMLGGDFLSKFTQFGSINDLLSKVGVSKVEDLVNVEKSKLDDVIKNNSSFGNWQELLTAAKDKLGGK